MKRIISITFAIMILAVCVLSLSSCSFCLPFSHDYGEWIEEVPATCSNDGRKGHYECRRCGEYFDENKIRIHNVIIESDGAHRPWTYVPEEPATCSKSGTIGYYVCSECGCHVNINGEEITDITTPPLKNHELSNWIKGTPATCTQRGTVDHYECENCSLWFDEDFNRIYNARIEFTHTYSEWHPETDSTCSVQGHYGYYQCTNCNKYYDENYRQIYNSSDIFKPFAHVYSNLIPEKTPTCTEDGYIAHYECTKCGKYFDSDKNEISDITLNGWHLYSWNYGTAATCTEDGILDHYSCKLCGKYFDNYGNEISNIIVPKKAHQYTSWIEEIKATCTIGGAIGHYECTTCDLWFDENYSSISKTFYPSQGHVLSNFIPKKSPTCAEDGYVAHYECTACHAYFNSYKTQITDVVIPKIDHTFGAWKEKDSTNTSCENKTYLRICAGCSLEETRSGTYEDHEFSTTYSTSDDEHWNECKKCGAHSEHKAHNVNSNGLCSVCNIPVEVTPGVIYDVSIDGTYAEVIGYTGTATKVKIASEYNGLPVKSIYSKAFYDNAKITSVIIPDSVISIGDHAFYSCDYLASVTIGDGVTVIGNYAFYYCDRLTSITIPNSVTIIGEHAFYSCDYLASVTLGNSVTSIGSYAFAYAYNLSSIIIPDSVTEISSYAFSGCSKLASVTICNGSIKIGNGAFNNCSSKLYTEYEYGKYVGDSKNPYYILYELTNKNFTTYTIHQDTVLIAYDTFKNCERLSKIAIPSNVKSVGEWAFYYCSNLTSVTIGKGVTRIDDYAFASCSSLSTVYYDGTSDDWAKITIGSSNTKLTNANRYYYAETQPNGLGEYWHYIDGIPTIWNSSIYSVGLSYTLSKDKSYYIVSGIGTCKDAEVTITPLYNGLPVKEISSFAFMECSIIDVTIPNSITSIGDYAFDYCTSLTSVVIGDSVTRIGEWAFSGCRSLTSIIISDTVTNIGSGAFYGCSSFKKVYYSGTPDDWARITIGSSNDELTYATRYYYSETQPTVTAYYWHYDENGNPTVWW